jgi:hypothetical protein
MQKFKFSIILKWFINLFVTVNMQMDRVILLHFSGLVSEQFELVGMRRQVLTFQHPPSFHDLIARVRAVMNVGCDLRLHGRYDMDGNRPIYVMLPLGSEDECQLYKSYASQSGLKGAVLW